MARVIDRLKGLTTSLVDGAQSVRDSISSARDGLYQLGITYLSQVDHPYDRLEGLFSQIPDKINDPIQKAMIKNLIEHMFSDPEEKAQRIVVGTKLMINLFLHRLKTEMTANRKNNHVVKSQSRNSRSTLRSKAVASSIWDLFDKYSAERSEGKNTVHLQTEAGNFHIFRSPHMLSITFTTDGLVVKATIGADKEVIKFKAFKRPVEGKCEDLELAILTTFGGHIAHKDICQQNNQVEATTSPEFGGATWEGFRQCTVPPTPDYTPTNLDERTMDQMIYTIVTALSPSEKVNQVIDGDLDGSLNIEMAA